MGIEGIETISSEVEPAEPTEPAEPAETVEPTETETPLENEPDVPEGDDSQMSEGTSVPPIEESDLSDAPPETETGLEDEGD